jgi:hypothetical protein
VEIAPGQADRAHEERLTEPRQTAGPVPTVHATGAGADDVNVTIDAHGDGENVREDAPRVARLPARFNPDQQDEMRTNPNLKTTSCRRIASIPDETLPGWRRRCPRFSVWLSTQNGV